MQDFPHNKTESSGEGEFKSHSSKSNAENLTDAVARLPLYRLFFMGIMALGLVATYSVLSNQNLFLYSISLVKVLSIVFSFVILFSCVAMLLAFCLYKIDFDRPVNKRKKTSETGSDKTNWEHGF